MKHSINLTRPHFPVWLCALVLLLGSAATAAAQEVNKLYVGDVTGMKSRSVDVPVYVDNTSVNIAALQFDVIVPEGVTIQTASSYAVVDKTRTADHQVRVRQLTGKTRTYRIMLVSPGNKTLRANKGKVFTVRADISTSAPLEEGHSYPLQVQNAVLSDSLAANVLTEFASGSLTIGANPDFVVENVRLTSEATTLAPGDDLEVGWTVRNQGPADSQGGWTEQVLLVSPTTGESVVVGNARHIEQLLPSGQTVDLTAAFTVPRIVGLDGQFRVQVKLSPASESGEAAEYQQNNTTTGTTNYTMLKRLYLNVPATVRETKGYTSSYYCTLERSGSRQQAETFTVSSPSTDARASLNSPQLTVSRGYSTAGFYVQVADNDVLDGDTIPYQVVVAAANGYEGLSATTQIIDDEHPDLTLTLSKSLINEGDTLTLTVATSRVETHDVKVQLTNDHPARFYMTSSLIIPAGQTQASTTVTAIDDNEPADTVSVQFTAAAPNCNNSRALLLLADNDMPNLTMTLRPSEVSESAGPQAVMGTITRGVSQAGSKLTIKVSTSNENLLYSHTPTITMQRGVLQANFSLGTIDNELKGGDQEVTVNAVVYISSCGCNTNGKRGGTASAVVLVTDDDGPTLKLTARNPNLLEGSTDNVMELERNDAPTSDLVVNISTTGGSDVVFPATVTIPQGQTKTTFTVGLNRNDTENDSRSFSFSAKADGYSSGTCWVMATDQTQPDATVTDLALVSSSVYATRPATLSLMLHNQGYADLPQKTPIGIYAGGRLVETVYTQEALPSGSITMMPITFTATLSDVAGKTEVYAYVNHDRSKRELNYDNNQSNRLQVTVLPLLQATSLSTDKANYATGEVIRVEGRTTGLENRNAEVEVYFVQGGTRQTVTVTTDDDGDFSAEWLPATGMAGRFGVGACMPGEKLSTEMAVIQIYGIRRATSTFLAHELEESEVMERYIDIVNPGTLTVSGIKAEAEGLADNIEFHVDEINGIPPGETRRLTYSIKGLTASENTREWQTFTLNLQSKEGATLQTTLYYVVYPATPVLKSNVQSINTTMVKDTVRTVELTLRNEGRKETGEINIDLGGAEWLRTATPQRMSSLAPGDETTVALLLRPTATMELNTVIRGNIYIAAANGGGLSIPMTVECVSEKTGSLTVDVWDEFTANTEEAPHVSEATVALLHPVTQKLLRQAVTGEAGTVSFADVAEGKYLLRVTHPKHDSWSDYVVVSPARETVQRVFIAYSAITVEMTYEPTEVEDEYNIVTTVNYETNVPAPVVKLDLPDRLMLAEINTPYVFYATLTNVGLVKALQTRFYIDEENGPYRFTPLIEGPWELLPQQTITVPIEITNVNDGTAQARGAWGPRKDPKEEAINCALGAIAKYRGSCNTWSSSSDAEYEARRLMQVGDACTGTADLVNFVTAALGKIGFSPSGGSNTPPGGGGFKEQQSVSGTLPESCDPCLNDNAPKYIGALLDMNSDDKKDKMKSGLTLLAPCEPDGSLPPLVAAQARSQRRDSSLEPQLYNIIVDSLDFQTQMLLCREVVRSLNGSEGKEPIAVPGIDGFCPAVMVVQEWQPSYVKAALRDLALAYDENFHNLAYIYHVLGNWNYPLIELEEAHALVEKVRQTTGELTTEEIAALQPVALDESQYAKVLERLYNGRNSSELSEDDYADYEKLDALYTRIEDDLMDINRKGYSTPKEMAQNVTAEAINKLQTDKTSTCATVKLQIDQKLTMTRQAVRGTLTVTNGSQSTPMTEVKLNLVVTDPDGNVASSHIMEIHTESIEGFEGRLDYESGWELAAGGTGVARIIFIPTKYAAPTEPLRYTFSGTISFIDPFTNLPVTRELETERLTVSPSPNLELTYFMQRDIFGDDALTPEVEPMVPSQFSLLINNKGYGDATKVKMVTNQPQVVDNEKGLLVDFEILSSQLNGGDKTLALGSSVTTDFGTIPAHSQAYAQWWLTSTLTGHFVSYDVKASHVTSYDNPDLTLLDTVTIHELIHQIAIPGGESQTPPLIGFLVNDEEDSDDLPDRLYLSDGTTRPVLQALACQVTKRTDTEYVLDVQTGGKGWNYGHVVDPTGGARKLLSIERHSDGARLPKENFWQTDRTLVDALDPVYENLLHFADSMEVQGEQYVVTFEERPAVVLAVSAISGLPAADSFTREKIDTVLVSFNKPINPATFSTDDLTLLHEGVAQDLSTVQIVRVNEQTFKLAIDQLTALNGYYSLSVQTRDIEDQLGFTGETGKMQGWIQLDDGMVNLRMEVSPEGAGTVTPGTQKQAFYGEVAVAAEAAQGYTFSRWLKGDEVLSEQASFTYDMAGEATLTAVFLPKSYQIVVSYDQNGGTIEGGGTGSYNYNETIVLTAKAKTGYYFAGWKHNGELMADVDDTLTFTVKGADSYEACFEPLQFVQANLQEKSNDNVSIFANPKGQYYKVTLDRKLSSGQWNTFCVPFDISEQQINKVWGYNTMLLQLKSMTAETLNFEYAWNIKAGVAYLVKPERTVERPELEYKGNLQLAREPIPTTFESEYGEFSYVGIYSPRAWDWSKGTEYYFGVTQTAIIIAKQTTSALNGMRGYFVIPQGANARVNIGGIETAVDEVLTGGDALPGREGRIYNLQGQYLGTDPARLPAGLYIINGKKQVLR